MDRYSGKRPVGSNASPTNKSSPATRDISVSGAQFCNRIGCSGRLNHTKPFQNTSSFTNVKKPLRESLKKLSSKTESVPTNSNKGVLKPVGWTVELGGSSHTRIQKFYGQTGSLDSLRRKNTVKNRPTDGETSSSDRGKNISGSLSLYGSSMSGSRHSTNWTDCRGSGVSSVRTRRPVNQHGNNPSPIQPSCVTPDNVDAIANILLALERIDQEDGFTYEQILGRSFLGGFNFYDHHRDMRLDIDNMSYEELLALEDEMGVVSTALSEEELSKCIRISLYKPFHMKEWRMRDNLCLDDTKCSICQEEFIGGDDIGRVGCDHGYHAVCIKQWLRLKNWCPICKASAKPSHS